MVLISRSTKCKLKLLAAGVLEITIGYVIAWELHALFRHPQPTYSDSFVLECEKEFFPEAYLPSLLRSFFFQHSCRQNFALHHLGLYDCSCYINITMHEPSPCLWHSQESMDNVSSDAYKCGPNSLTSLKDFLRETEENQRALEKELDYILRNS
ncbi:hypothetical protein OTU49_014597 [Cherax quadricarinatus]|uniref:Uncharacterized protein n=1 Tax=Cherax quadricarinatus TaxID=27406 RepID=A0AAW0VPA5_CHEQU